MKPFKNILHLTGDFFPFFFFFLAVIESNIQAIKRTVQSVIMLS